MARRYYEEVCPTLNAYFDAVLVHGDPKVTRLEDHFPWVEDLVVPVVYTGFVCERLVDRTPPSETPDRYVLVSAGGGAEGYAIAAPCIEAWKRLHDEEAVGDRVMVIFAGAFIDDAHFEALQELCGDGPFYLERFTSGFLRWMHGAELSVSRAGYNTCMNLLETRTRAILVPSVAMDDQEYRAQRLRALDLADVVHPDRLSVGRMAEAISSRLSVPETEHNLALDGAEEMRRFVLSL